MPNKQFIGEHKLFLFVGFLTFVLLFTVMNINNRFTATDFEVYYYAAKAFLEGKPIYGVAFGNSDVGFYKYSPFSMLLYVPATLLPFRVAASVNYFFLAATGLVSIMISSYLVVKKIYTTNSPVTNTLLFITFFISLTFLNREVRMGNVNNLLLLLICLSFVYTGKQKTLVNGLFWGAAIAFKPYIIIVLLPVFMRKKFKLLLSTMIWGFALAVVPVLLAGLEKGLEYYRNWYAAMHEHSDYIISSFTIDALMHKYLIAGAEYNLTWHIILFVVFGYIAIKLFGMYYSKNLPGNEASSEKACLLESFSLLALIPNLVNTDSQQLLYSIPLVAFLTWYMLEKRKLYLLFPYILLFFFFSVNQPDILGRNISGNLYHMGIAGICNLLIIALSWVIFLGEKKLFTDHAAQGT